MDRSVEKLRKGLDRYTQRVPDQSGFEGYVGLWATASNSLPEIRNTTAVKLQTELLG